MKPYCTAIFACVLFCGNIYPQVDVPVFGNQQLINGWARSLQGETIPYISLYEQYVKEALLTRCTDGTRVIEWETDPVPQDSPGDYMYFNWIAAHSTGTSGGERQFDLYINDTFALTLTTLPENYPRHWSFSAPDSTCLVFVPMKKDWVGDAHGMVYLRVPRAKCQPGKSLRLKLVGHAQDSPDWFMTFAYAFREKIDVRLRPFLVKNAQKGLQPVRFTVLHFGAPVPLNIAINDIPRNTFVVNHGFNSFEVQVPPVQADRPMHVQVRLDRRVMLDTVFTQCPVTFREINLVHHAHTDIGYSHVQEEVIVIHNDNIRRGLRLIEQTRDYPEGSRFIWNIESAWAVENFLQSATTTERDAFFEAVRNRQIGLSALYANILTGLASPEEMSWALEYACSLREQENLPVRTVLFSDIPGISWSMVEVLAQNGIRYFSNGPNYIPTLPDKGDRIGSTLSELGNKAYWWVSPDSRDSILLWTCGKGYSSWHGMGEGGLPEKGADKIADYLDELDTLGYPYDMVQWRYNIVSDNGPTDSTLAGFVRDWNAVYASPRLRITEAGDMFERFEKKYGRALPVLRGDYTPYWEDGAYSTAREEGENRVLSARLVQLEKLARQENLPIREDWRYQAHRNVVLFHEHTWGAWCSVSRPDDHFSVHQWEYKKNFLDSARYYIGRIEAGLNQALRMPGEIIVVNTLDWARSGYVAAACPAGFKGGCVLDANGNAAPVQRLSGDRVLFRVTDVPANGKKSYRLVPMDCPPPADFVQALEWAPDTVAGSVGAIRWDNRQWVAPGPFGGLVQPLYVAGLDPGQFALAKCHDLAWQEWGPLLRKLRMNSEMAGSRGVATDVSWYSGADYLKCTVRIDKQAIRDKESIHIALPLALSNPRVRIGIGDTLFEPGAGQTPGANRDFFSVQRWIDVSNDKHGATISCPQGALFEIGQMVDERPVHVGYKKWKSTCEPSATLFLYLLNNYWHTNYKADQDGEVEIDLYLSFHRQFEAETARRFGLEVAQPLRVIGEW